MKPIKIIDQSKIEKPNGQAKKNGLGRENERVEFKKSSGEVKDAMDDIAAMLNKHGEGTLYFGVKPDGEVCGQDIGKDTLDDVARHCKDAIRPRIYPVIKEEAIKGFPCIVVRFEGKERPYASYGRYFMRVVDRSEPMSPEALKAMMVATDYTSRWENNPTPYGLEAIDREALRVFYAKAISCGRIDPMVQYDEEALLSSLGLLNEGKLNNAGYYLFSSRQPVVLKMATYLTDERIGFSDLRRIKGNIFNLIPIALNYIKERINWRAKPGEGASRIEVPEIPVEALREIVVNAFAHADYRGVTEHEIDITPTRIEIYSPGSFPTNLTPDAFANDFRKSQPRNRVILDTLYKSKEVEIFGSGFRKVYSLCKKPGIRLAYDSTEDGFSFVFEREAVGALNGTINGTINGVIKDTLDFCQNDYKVLHAIKEDPRLPIHLLATKLKLGTRTVQRSLDKLANGGKIVRIGSRKNGYWEIVPGEEKEG